MMRGEEFYIPNFSLFEIRIKKTLITCAKTSFTAISGQNTSRNIIGLRTSHHISHMIWLISSQIHCETQYQCGSCNSHLLRRGWRAKVGIIFFNNSHLFCNSHLLKRKRRFEIWIISLTETDITDQVRTIFWGHNWDRNNLYWIFNTTFDWEK